MTTGGKPVALHERIARELLDRIERESLAFLPSVRILCRQYGASSKTVSSAVRLLREKGVVAGSRGRKVRVVGMKKGVSCCGAEEMLGESVSQLCDMIRERICDATYRAGEQLPKVTHFVVSDRVSPNTVCDGFDHLQGEGLVYKHGKRWIVGKPPSQRHTVQVNGAVDTGSPVVLIVVKDNDAWRTLFTSHLSLLPQMFCGELERHGLQFVVVQTDESQACRGDFVAGRSEILSCITSLGSRFLGAFVAMHHDDIKDLGEWISWLCQFDRPVIWADYDNAAPHLDRKAIGRKGYFRCYGDEAKVVTIALERLRGLGHRRIAFPMCRAFREESWFKRRVEEIRRQSEALDPPLQVLFSAQDEPLWQREQTPSDKPASYNADYNLAGRGMMFEFLDGVRSTLRATRPKMSETKLGHAEVRRLLQSVPSLKKLVVDDPVDAILASNQLIGINYYCWLKHAGIGVPDQVSLLTFDNRLVLARYPVSTVDLRLDGLAYKAAHIFIGDIPVRSDCRGNIASQPQLVDRGSIGAPARCEVAQRRGSGG